MVASKTKQIQVFSFLGITLSLFMISFMLQKRNNSVSETQASSPLSTEKNINLDSNKEPELTLLDNRQTIAESLNSNVASELQKTEENSELNQLLQKTEITSVVEEERAKISKTFNIDRKSANSFYDKGLIYSIYQKYPEAIANYDRALALNPELILGYYHRGIAREKLGEIATAIQDFQKAQSLAQKQNDLTALEMAQQKLDYLVK
ncbi:hypothetical protein H1P_2260008 [Hyella patelloides LEGE 07179]|uniref:Uncharacterized protein n=1 Tax=Hyella patelloides LEGE 07179 TaxID=945734 RepID=A0A563VRK5_9CYAN|nr:tetratricopeptide repeat protein [Hyella patelloides]VEP13907.1 hypothetical protein H1P_2260008 [Hyella patelloides LEGE 07179]